MMSISNNLLLFEIDNKQKVAIPKLEFFNSLLKNADIFFNTMHSILKENCDFEYELEKITELNVRL